MLLLGLARGEVYEPYKEAFGDEANHDEDERGEQLGLVIEDGNGAVGRADAFEPVELPHFP